MPKFRIFPRAAADLDGIADYTKREHGDRQCGLYVGQLYSRFARLRESTVLERACDAVRPGLKCQQQGRHMVFYLHDKDEDVLIVRVLHEHMNPGDDFTDEEDLSTRNLAPLPP